MTGGLIQIMSYGAQDSYLTDSPQTNFWKVKYNKYSNISVDPYKMNTYGRKYVNLEIIFDDNAVSYNGIMYPIIEDLSNLNDEGILFEDPQVIKNIIIKDSIDAYLRLMFKEKFKLK